MAEAPHTPPPLLHRYFELRARQHPDRIAVDVPPGPDRPDRSLTTYGQLQAEADSLAACLRGLASPDDVIGILLPRDSHRLYAAQLAVLKASAAFTCIDPVFPVAHVSAVLLDANVSVLLTDRSGLERIARSGTRIEHVLDVAALTEQPARQPARPSRTPNPNHLAYVIYTSGTTGAPKGVMIEHRSIVNLVASDLEEFRLTTEDRVAQGSSAAYDSSIEETWLAFAAGATLVVMDDQASRLGPDLPAWLRNERITVFCPPPTLLRSTGCTDPAAELPELRLLYVGGEALTPELADLWSRSRRMVNGYGPTECTVTVVRADVSPGRPVTIGKPVPGNSAWVVDADLTPLPDGADGELCITGAGLARGYRNRTELTGQKFPVHPHLGRMYRTGDLVRRNTDGNLVYLGRIDAQVKLRGYRMELEAIEAHLTRCPGVREAACRVQGDGGAAILTAHLVPTDPDSPPDFGSISNSLRQSLPPYMVPARYGIVTTLPRTIGGKVDRKSLPVLDPVRSESCRQVVAPRTPDEARIVAAFASGLRIQSPISIDDDFFLDLGGDSLSAVAVVCSLREHVQTARVTTRDLYESRTPARLAACLRSPPRRTTGFFPSHAIAPGHSAHPVWTTLGQALWLLVELLLASAAAFLVVLHLLPLLLDRFGILGTALLEVPIALAGLLGYTLLTVALTAAAKWTLIGRYTPIRTPVWSCYYFRHWVVQSLARTIPWNMLAGTVACGAVLRALGATVGRRVHIHRGVNLQRGGWDLLTLGDDVTLSREAHLGLVEIDAGCLCVGPVTIHEAATLDIRASVGPHTTIEPGGYLTALSWLSEGQRIPAGQRWDGVPASIAGLCPPAPSIPNSKLIHPAVHAVVHLSAAGLAWAGASLPLLVVLIAVARLLGLSASQIEEWLAHPAWSMQPSLLAATGLSLWIPVWLACKALSVRLVGRVQATTINRWSLAYIRVWFKTGQVESAGLWLTGTLFWPIWLRLAGMRVGPGCEISTIIDVVPETLSIGPESFFADGIYLGAPHIHRGTVTIRQTSLGRDTFLGNHAVIPAGSHLPDDVFVGVSTVADARLARQGSSWFGHPPLELPRREVVSVDRSLTHNPSLVRFCNRVFWESLRFALPIFPLIVLSGWLKIFSLSDAGVPFDALVMAPVATLAAIVTLCAAVVVLKWFLLGRARAGQHPLWSCWCSRWDFLYVAWQFYALVPLAALEGTLFQCMFLRAMGSRIGRRVVLGSGFGQVADPDMIVIEDNATVCANYQAHSFEDRVLKLAPVTVRRSATVGESAVVFYGADIGRHAWVSPNSVVMKNERIGPGLSYGGCPVQSLGDETDPNRQSAPSPAPEPPPTPASPAGRVEFLDTARGLAVIGMIYVHFVPAENSASEQPAAWSSIAYFLEGKPAALFCVLAGAAWELQALRSASSPRYRWYFLRRALILAAVGIPFHIFAWPTEILVAFSLMMLLAIAVRRLGRWAPLSAALAVLLCVPAVSAFLGQFIQTDWNQDGSHASDLTLGWATLRALLFDGNYPIVPWLAFPLVGMLMVHRWRIPRTSKAWFAGAATAFALSQSYVLWANANPETLGNLSPYLGSTWVPTSLPFVAVAGSCALAIISAFAWWQGPYHSIRGLATIRLFGRASLSHYLLHICLLYLPLRAILGHDQWSAWVGVWMFVGYLAIALPCTVWWFHRFNRGPFEELWARASGAPAPPSLSNPAPII